MGSNPIALTNYINDLDRLLEDQTGAGCKRLAVLATYCWLQLGHTGFGGDLASYNSRSEFHRTKRVIRLWGRSTSSNVMKVIWLLEELGLKYERIDVGGAFGGTETPHYRAMNPLGLIPALEDDDFTLFESNAILRYICNAHAPQSAIYPKTPRDRASVEAWMDFQQTALSQHQSIVFRGLIRTKPENRDDAMIAGAINEAARIWAILDARFALHPYVAGDEITLADFAFGPHVHRWFTMSFERPDAPHLYAWYQRLRERPAFKAHCMGPLV